MSKTPTVICIVIALLFTTTLAFSQTISIAGSVLDRDTGQPLSGATVSVVIDSTAVGTKTGKNGQFQVYASGQPPFTLSVSQLGYVNKQVQVTGTEKNLRIELESENILGQDVVVSASRVPEPILRSPVSIERLGSEALKQSPYLSVYEAIGTLKGVDRITQSMTFTSLNTRGFNANANSRFNQLIDGMDNQAPGLNFSIGNIISLTDLDIDNIELLPGASSALYGAGGTNGTLLMTSKSPFEYPGLAVKLRMGINGRNSAWPDLSMRYAKSINDKLGFKVAASYFRAEDWQADDYSNFDRITRKAKAGTRDSDPMYDGVNVYGDEPNFKFPTLTQVGALVKAQAGSTPPENLSDPVRAIINAYDNNLLPNSSVTRTGYLEKDLVDYNAKAIKTSAALHYKLTEKTEAIAEANWGIGTSNYTGSDRYSLRNFNIGQYKLELRGENFFLRGYTTRERSGDAYDANLLASLINESWKPSAQWFQDYTTAFATARLQGFSELQSAGTARSFADRDRPEPGSPQFNMLKEKISTTNIGNGVGARFDDRSKLYHYEGMYNFSHLLNNSFEFLVGSSYRVYALNSAGTIFDDLNNKIRLGEYGAYTQIGKQVSEDLKLTASMRYDKNENFNGSFTPRFTGVYTVAPNNNIRASYQTGFRNPSNQHQYLDLAAAGNTIRLIGGLPEKLAKYDLYTNRPYTDQSYRQFLSTGNPAVLQRYNFDPSGIKPEKVRAFELGYKGLFSNSLLLDTYGYYNVYRDYITGVEVYQNPTPNSAQGLADAVRYNVPVNNPGRVTSWGMALGLDYRWNVYGLNGNISYNKLGNIPEGYFNDFNTPEVRFNLEFSSREILKKNIGFNLAYRWQSSYLWQSPFVSGHVPSYGTLDGQLSFKIPAYNSTIQLGGANLLNRYYRTSYGNPSIGGTYYITLLFDQSNL